jgi:hypothetical protein
LLSAGLVGLSIIGLGSVALQARKRRSADPVAVGRAGARPSVETLLVLLFGLASIVYLAIFNRIGFVWDTLLLAGASTIVAGRLRSRTKRQIAVDVSFLIVIVVLVRYLAARYLAVDFQGL